MDAAKKLTIVFACLFTLALALMLPRSEAAGTSHAKKSHAKPLSPAQKDFDLQKREEMVKISRQLSVTCDYCHDTANLKKATMPTFKVALEHIRITRLLNEEGFKGKPEVDCFLCHRGKAKPDYQEHGKK